MAGDTSVAGRPSGRRPGRLPGIANIAGAVLVLLAVVAVALHAQSSQPPSIAEFAPQAQQIKQAPQEQTSVVGSAPGGGAGPGPVPSPLPSPSGVPPGAVLLHCVGDPPRQIEDPQSPPCVAYWQGNNGGSTFKGVNANTITIVMPDEGSAVNDPHMDSALENFFNARFEFYNRKIHIVPLATNACAGDAAKCRTQGIAAEQQENPFASMHTSDQDGYDYYDQLAKEQIISASGREVFSDATLAAHAPYMWQYQMGADTLMRNLADWACTQLAGHPASHASGSDTSTPPRPLNTDPRVFGLITNTEDGDNPLSFSTMTDSLSACGIHIAARNDFPNQSGLSPQDASNAMVNMRTHGVTSIFCLCHIGSFNALGAGANGQNYFPEWLMSSYELLNWDGEEHDLNPNNGSQIAHVFGLMPEPMEWYQSAHMEYVAMREANPAFTPTGNGATGLGQEAADQQYHSLLLLASGIQMAGRRSTRRTSRPGCTARCSPIPTRGTRKATSASETAATP